MKPSGGESEEGGEKERLSNRGAIVGCIFYEGDYKVMVGVVIVAMTVALAALGDGWQWLELLYLPS